MTYIRNLVIPALLLARPGAMAYVNVVTHRPMSANHHG